MDGTRVQHYWSNEMEALLNTYQQFQILIPSKKDKGAAHRGEDGRYVESLLKEYLKRYLPHSLEVLTGFILRPSVKTGLNNKNRKNQIDSNSTQLDIIVYNSGQFPVFQRFGDTVIVPPEGVIAVISVKKHLYEKDIIPEMTALTDASLLCRCSNTANVKMRGPFLALISMESYIEKKTIAADEWIFSKLKSYYESSPINFDDLVGYIGSLKAWSIFKARPSTKNSARYISFNHSADEIHLGFQFLLTGVLSVFYDETRSSVSRPGFTAFPSERKHDKDLGEIKYVSLR